MRLQFPQPFAHKHPPVQNVNVLVRERLTLGQRAADIVARVAGSWQFIIIQSVLLTCWVIVNILAVAYAWDPYPFILMNLVLSLQAAYTAPIIMMSQNRQNLRDRVAAEQDYEINRKAETEVRAVLDHLAAQNAALGEIHRLLVAHLGPEAVAALTPPPNMPPSPQTPPAAQP